MAARPDPARTSDTYHHGSLRGALIAAALCAALDAELDRSGDGFFAVVGLGVAYTKFAMHSPSHFRFMYGTSPATSAPLERRHLEVLDRLRRTAELAIDAGLVKHGQGERRALDLVRATVAGMLLGTKPPDSSWRPDPPRRPPRDS